MTTRRDTGLTEAETSMVARSPSMIMPTEMSDADFELIRSGHGDTRASVSKNDYYGFEMIASGDGLDSYYTRQDLGTSFPNFVRDLKKGQAVLGSHQMATFAYGSSYDGRISPADPGRAEYEPTFYPQWDTPDLRTSNWLIGKYFISRGLEFNGQKTDDLIRGLELGNIRKASISFMVGSYVCGIDGRDLLDSWLGPMPDEECNHFPGINYEGQIGWALMKNNVLLETSLVYKNASPSSMLLRKAEAMSSRGVLKPTEIMQLEQRFQVRLPGFENRVFAGVTVEQIADEIDKRALARSTAAPSVQEDSDMAKRDDATRELVREVLSTEPEPEEDETAVAESTTEDAKADKTEATDEADKAETEATPDEADAEAETPEPVVAEAVDGEADEAEKPEAVAVVSEAPEEAAVSSEAVVEPDVSEHKGHGHGGEDKGGHLKVKKEEDQQDETSDEDQEDAISEFVQAADRLASYLSRTPDGASSAQLAAAARAERSLDLALLDAGCDTTVGSHVARNFELRGKAVRDVLGEPISVEAIRSLQSRATLGDTLYEDLVKDAVAARVGVQGETFNAGKYREVLLSTRDSSYVKEEIDSWKAAKSDRFSAGRSVVPREPVDLTPTKEARKTLPTRPDSSKSAAESSDNLLTPRTKK